MPQPIENQMPSTPSQVQANSVKPASHSVGEDQLMAKSGFSKLITLSPYDHLMSPMVKVWILAVRFVIFIMALTEGIAWGYVGSLFFDGYLSILVGTMIGIGWFSVILLIDGKLVLHDSGSPVYQGKRNSANIVDVPSGSPSTITQRLSRFLIKNKSMLMSMTARWGIVVLSLVFTAPWLALCVFRNDISDKLETRKTQAVAAARTGINTRYAGLMDSIQKNLEKIRLLQQAEASGQKMAATFMVGDTKYEVKTTGRSGTTGPASKMLTQLHGKFEEEVKKVEQAQAVELKEFDALLEAGQYRQLREKWGFEFSGDTLMNRWNIRTELAKQPAYAETERIIQVGLMLIFLALSILKLFQPQSARLYLSEYAQDRFQEFLAGVFDPWLPEKFKSGEKGMTPHRFEEFLCEDYPAWYQNEQKKQNGRRLKGELEEAETEAQTQYEAQYNQFVTRRQDLKNLETQHETAQNAIDQQTAQVHSLQTRQAELEAMKNSLARQIEGQKADHASIQVLQKVVTECQQIKQALEGESNRLNLLTKQHQALVDEVAFVKTEVADLNSRVQSLKSGLDQIRKFQADHRVEKAVRACQDFNRTNSALPFDQPGNN